MDIEKPITGGYFTGGQFPIGLLLHSYSVQEWGFRVYRASYTTPSTYKVLGSSNFSLFGSQGLVALGLAYSNELL